MVPNQRPLPNPEKDNTSHFMQGQVEVTSQDSTAGDTWEDEKADRKGLPTQERFQGHTRHCSVSPSFLTHREETKAQKTKSFARGHRLTTGQKWLELRSTQCSNPLPDGSHEAKVTPCVKLPLHSRG